MGIFNMAGSFVKERVSNTKAAFELIIEDFKRYALVIKWIFLGFSFATVIFNIITKTGDLIINSILIAVLLIYAVLDTIFKKLKKPDPNRKLRITYAWIRILLNAAALASSIYTLYTATAGEVIKPISIVLTTLSLLMFILKVLLEICIEIFSSKWKLLKSAMIMDAKEHPNTSGKIFSPFVGDVSEVEVRDSIVERIKDRQNR